jgi:hypothetical protein
MITCLFSVFFQEVFNKELCKQLLELGVVDQVDLDRFFLQDFKCSFVVLRTAASHDYAVLI